MKLVCIKLQTNINRFDYYYYVKSNRINNVNKNNIVCIN